MDIGDGEPIRKLPYNRSGNLLLFCLSYASMVSLTANVSFTHRIIMYLTDADYFFLTLLEHTFSFFSLPFKVVIELAASLLVKFIEWSLNLYICGVITWVYC